MIKITYKQLLTVLSAGFNPDTKVGAYGRFATIRKAITAGHKNRKMPAAVQEEIKHFNETRDAIIARFGGMLNATKTDYDWLADKKDEGVKAIEELLAQEVELPGERIKMTDLLDGGLCEGDYEPLEPFLTE
jgi:hypothetical protein